jgi:hypothetical protein
MTHMLTALAAMMFRWVSEVPTPMVEATLMRYRRSTRPSRGA